MYAKWLLILLEWDEIFSAFIKSIYLFLTFGCAYLRVFLFHNLK